jgi:hypothetical protein
MLTIWETCKGLVEFGNFHKFEGEKKESKFVLLSNLFQFVLEFFHLFFLRVKWIDLDQIGSTIEGTKQEDFEYLDIYQNRKTKSAGTYHFENKMHCTKQFGNHNNIFLGIKFLTK